MPSNIHAGIPGPALLSSTTPNSSAKGSLATSTAPQPTSFSSSFSAFASAPSASQSSTPQPNYQSSVFAPPPKPQEDPFAALVSPTFSSKPATPTPARAASATVTNEEDEWSFSSALPLEASLVPREHSAVVTNGPVKIELLASRSVGAPNAMNLMFSLTNNTAHPIFEVHFETAVTKVC